MEKEGWIKLHRKSLDNFLYNEPRPHTKREAWEDLLLMVNHKSMNVFIDGEKIEVQRGQSILSLKSWAEHFNWSIQQVRTFFNLLVKEKMITKEGLRKTTRITICNWETYQDFQQTDNNQITDRQQPDNNQITTNNNVKNIKNEKNEKNSISVGTKRKSFVPPTIEDVINFFNSKYQFNLPVAEIEQIAESFHSYYESNGWMVGRNKMVKWQAAAGRWKYEPKPKEDIRKKSKLETAIIVNKGALEMVDEMHGIKNSENSIPVNGSDIHLSVDPLYLSTEEKEIRLKALEKEMLTWGTWHDEASKAFKRTRPIIEKLIREFLLKLVVSNEYFKSLNELQKYFYNWAKKQENILNDYTLNPSPI